MKLFFVLLLIAVLLPEDIAGTGSPKSIEDKEERHGIVKEALETLESYSNNLFARKVTKVSPFSR
jgi:hypothetical protein